jgi:hypothetical protein
VLHPSGACFQQLANVRGVALGGGLLIHFDLFAQTDFRMEYTPSTQVAKAEQLSHAYDEFNRVPSFE